MPHLTETNGASPSKHLPKLAPTHPVGDTGTAAGSDSDSDAELVSHIHPDLLLQHQNQLSLQHQVQVGSHHSGRTAILGLTNDLEWWR